jgi:group I intron endonuclease
MTENTKPVVYLITCTETNKKYVGIARVSAEYRFKRHCESARKGSRCYLHRAIRKYGKENFTVETLDTAADWAEAQVKEQFFIDLHQCFNPTGYNMTRGGEGLVGFKHRDASKAAMSRGHTGKVVSNETRARMSASKKGVAKTAETRARMAEAQKRRAVERPDIFARFLAVRPTPGPLTEEHKAKLSAATKGRVQSPEEIAARLPFIKAALQRPEVKAKLSARNKGRVLSEEAKAKIRESCRKAALANTELRAKVAAANAARVWTDEARAKASALRKGVPKSPEHRQKMREATTLSWARRRAKLNAALGETQ